MGSTGIVFDIREFTLHDGPGLRTTVFMKGCPLSCAWCHNPEGQSAKPQIIHSPAGERVAGDIYTAPALAKLLNRQAEILKSSGGGVTFSGGEPLRQPSFVAAVIDRLEGLHVLLDTSGYASESAFRQVAARTQLVYYDLKLMDPEAHRRYTGRDNRPILRNLSVLGTLGVPCVIRVPLVPGVTDTDANLTAIAATAAALPTLMHVELLPYNPAAGAKYAAAGMVFKPDYDEGRPLNLNTAPFERVHVPVRVV